MVVVIDLNNVPEIIQGLRLQMSKMLREASLDEDARTAKRLQEIAVLFEIGVEDEAVR